MSIIFKYFATYLKLPWSILSMINLVCFVILVYAQQTKQIICPDNGLCARDIIQTYDRNPEKAYLTMVSYFAFYLLGILFIHIYSFYSEQKNDKINTKLSQTMAFFLVSIMVVFTCVITFVYINSGL